MSFIFLLPKLCIDIFTPLLSEWCRDIGILRFLFLHFSVNFIWNIFLFLFEISWRIRDNLIHAHSSVDTWYWLVSICSYLSYLLEHTYNAIDNCFTSLLILYVLPFNLPPIKGSWERREKKKRKNWILFTLSWSKKGEMYRVPRGDLIYLRASCSFKLM